MNNLYEILIFLENADVIKINEGGKKHSIQNIMLTKKRVSGLHASGKQFSVELSVDIEELTEALEKAEDE